MFGLKNAWPGSDLRPVWGGYGDDACRRSDRLSAIYLWRGLAGTQQDAGRARRADHYLTFASDVQYDTQDRGHRGRVSGDGSGRGALDGGSLTIQAPDVEAQKLNGGVWMAGAQYDERSDRATPSG